MNVRQNKSVVACPYSIITEQMTEFSFVQTRMFESVAVRYFNRNSHNVDLIKTKKKPFPVTDSRMPFGNLPPFLLEEKEHFNTEWLEDSEQLYSMSLLALFEEDLRKGLKWTEHFLTLVGT